MGTDGDLTGEASEFAARLDYDALARLIKRTLPNGTDTSPSFDAASRLTGIAHVAVSVLAASL